MKVQSAEDRTSWGILDQFLCNGVWSVMKGSGWASGGIEQSRYCRGGGRGGKPPYVNAWLCVAPFLAHEPPATHAAACPRLSVSGVQYQWLEKHPMDFKEQMEWYAGVSMYISVVGAQQINTFFMPDWGALVELDSCGATTRWLAARHGRFRPKRGSMLALAECPGVAWAAFVLGAVMALRGDGWR